MSKVAILYFYKDTFVSKASCFRMMCMLKIYLYLNVFSEITKDGYSVLKLRLLRKDMLTSAHVLPTKVLGL